MRALLQRLSRRLPTEHGMSLVEVVVAMMIFLVVSTAVLGSLIQILGVTRDNRLRQVAANLAAQEIDLAREATDLFSFTGGTKTIEIDGTDFAVSTSAGWEGSSEASNACGTSGGGGVIRYKRVNVAVTWEGMRPGASGVTSDTVIDPETRINDPALGTIIVSVLGGGGSGVKDVSVSVVPVSGTGAVSPPVAPSKTDAQGCSYALRLSPGTYKVSISHSANNPKYITSDNTTAVAVDTSVVASSAKSVAFTYDRANKITANYVAPPTPANTKIPRDLKTTYSHTTGQYVQTATSSALSRTAELFPWASGYRVIAGEYKAAPLETAPGDAPAASCVAPDPGAWTAGPVGSQTYAGTPPAAVGGVPGASASALVPMGTFKITGLALIPRLRAVSVAGQGADPGCSTGDVYYYDNSLASVGATTFALPYGTWRIERSNGVSNVFTQVPGSSLVVSSPSVVNADGTITLDPRTPVVTP